MGGGFRLRGERFLPTRHGHKRVDTYGFHPLVNHPFPLGIARRLFRTETIKERQRIFASVGADQCVRPFLYLFAMPETLLLHIPATLCRRGMTVPRNSLARIFCMAPTNCTRYTVGCADLGAPYPTVGTIYIRIRAHLTISWAANDRPYGDACADGIQKGRTHWSAPTVRSTATIITNSLN